MRTTQTTRKAVYFFVTFLFTCALVSCARRPRNYVITSDSQPSYRDLRAVTNKQSSSENTPVININESSAAELEKLPGIGEKLAIEIVNHRKRYGRFRRAEHLLMVRGISESRLRAMRSLITVE